MNCHPVMKNGLQDRVQTKLLTVFLSDAVAVGHSVEEDAAAKVVAGERPGGPREVLRAAVGGAE